MVGLGFLVRETTVGVWVEARGQRGSLEVGPHLGGVCVAGPHRESVDPG